MEMEKQIKTLSYKVVDVDNKKRLVKAYFSAFGNVDDDEQIVMPGALTKSINESGPNGKNKIKHYLNHDLFLFKNGKAYAYNPEAIPLGKVIEMGTDNYGGYFVSKMARTLRGEDIYNMYEDGMIDEHSFSYEIIKSLTRKDNIEVLYELKISEVSTVTTVPANPGAYTIDVKQQNSAVVKDTVNKYESLFIEPSRYTQKEIADLQTIYKLLNF